MKRKIACAILLALFSCCQLTAQEIGQTSVVVESSAGCSDCQSAESGCCKKCDRSMPALANADIWSRDFFRGCGGGRVDWLSNEDFCPKNYLSFFGGYSNIDNFERRQAAGNVVDVTTFQMLDGYAVGGALGRQIHPLFRIETEFTMRDHGVGNFREDTFTNGFLTATNTVAATGSLETYSWMNNFIIDFPPRKEGCANLYAGGGIGILYAEGDVSTAATDFAINDSSFAFQFIGGVNVPVRDHIDFFTEYRYMGANNVTVDDVTNAVSMGDFNFDSHNVFFGFRIFRR